MSVALWWRQDVKEVGCTERGDRCHHPGEVPRVS